MELERQITANLAEGKSVTQKRGERKLNSVSGCFEYYTNCFICVFNFCLIETIALDNMYTVHCMSDVILQVFVSPCLQPASGNTVSETDAREEGGPL